MAFGPAKQGTIRCSTEQFAECVAIIAGLGKSARG
jgi:hypothetical protein